MAKQILIHLRSGTTLTIECEPNEQDTDEAALEFYNAIDFSKTTTLRIKNVVVLLREIEAFQFI